MRIIALEEHFSFPLISGRIPKEILAVRGLQDPADAPPRIQEANQKLPEIGKLRLDLMDQSGISLQVLSYAGPGAELLPADEGIVFAQDYNNALAEKIALNPSRFAGFAHLPMATPEDAAIELERAVKQLGFCGAMICGTINTLFLDDPKFAPVLAKAQQLDVPLYLHPAVPPPGIQDIYYKRLPKDVSSTLATAGFGWHAETAIHILRLVGSGTLDSFPKLQLIIGHLGEMLPFMMARTEGMLNKEMRNSERSLSEILKTQVNITTSGMFTVLPFALTLGIFGTDRLLFSVDYPYAENEKGKQFLDQLNISTEDFEKLTHGNAERLLKIKPE